MFVRMFFRLIPPVALRQRPRVPTLKERMFQASWLGGGLPGEGRRREEGLEEEEAEVEEA